MTVMTPLDDLTNSGLPINRDHCVGNNNKGHVSMVEDLSQQVISEYHLSQTQMTFETTWQ